MPMLQCWLVSKPVLHFEPLTDFMPLVALLASGGLVSIAGDSLRPQRNIIYKFAVAAQPNGV